MEACAVICRKATVALPDANFFSFYAALPSSRAQNRVFCAFLASETLIFGRFEHKIEVFVRFCPSEPLFSGISSTKSAFLCSGGGKGAPGSVTTETLSQVLPDETPGQQHLPERSPPQRPGLPHLPDRSSPRRPGQQQTSSGGEKYSGLASNLAHLGRIC